MGKAGEAERLLASALADVIEATRAGRPLPAALVDQAAKFSAKLANRLVKPGAPQQSIVSLRAHAVDARRMPPLAKTIADPQGTALIDAWIGALTGCP